MSAFTERWVCGRCPATGPPRAVSLQDAARSIADPRPAQPTPCPPPPQHAVADMAQMPPPSLPFTEHTNSRIYVPLLLHAAGMVSPETRASWFADASIGDWRRRQFEAVSARTFLPVHDTVAAIAFVAQARGDDLRQSAPFQRLVEWTAPRSSGAESLCARGGPLFCGSNTGGAAHISAGPTRRLDLGTGYCRSSPAQRVAPRRVPATPAYAAGPVNACATCARRGAHPTGCASRAGTTSCATTRVLDRRAGHHTRRPRRRRPPRRRASTHRRRPCCRTSQGVAGHSALAGIPAAVWSSLDAVDLAAEFGTPVPTMQSVPVFLRSGVRQAFVLALLALRDAYARGTAPQQTRAWKLFLLATRLLLYRPREPATVGREALLQRSRDFLAGRWDTLLSATRTAAAAPRAGSAAHVADAADAEAFRERRRALACANVRRKEVSRARATLTSAAIAPGTDETFAALSDRSRARRCPCTTYLRRRPGPVPPDRAPQARRRRPRHSHGRLWGDLALTHACSRGFARRASSPVRGHAAWWSP